MHSNISIKKPDSASISHYEASIANQFEHYMSSHIDDTLALLKAKNLQLVINADKEQPISCSTQQQQTQLTVNLGTATKVLAVSKAFQWGNGVVIIPTIFNLIKLKFLHALESGGKTILQLSKIHGHADADKNSGNLKGALHLLSLQGWLSEKGLDEETQFNFTEQGRIAFSLIQKHYSTFEKLNSAISELRKYHHYCYSKTIDDKILNNFIDYKLLCQNHWDIEVTGSPLERRVATHLINFLDGLLIGPVLVALGMPFFEKKEGRLIARNPSVFDVLQQKTNDDDLADVNQQFISIAFDLLQSKNIVAINDKTIELTTWGKSIAKLAPPMIALSVSYLKTYECLEQMLIDNNDPLGIGDDLHVDRTMNVWGSSGAGSGPASAEICDYVIRQQFDELALEEQAYGIADIGCGDGTALKNLAEYIIKHTKRGKNLKQYPLYVIGADFNAKPLEITKETLSVFDNIEGVNTVVISADVTKPEAYNASLKALNLAVKDHQTGEKRVLALDDLLHTFMFLVHNRRLELQNKEEALEVLRQQLSKTNKKQLAAIIERYFGEAMETDDEALLKQISTLFKTSFADKNGLVKGVVAGADLVAFFDRWRPWAKHGFMSLEGHSPDALKMLEAVPDNENDWMRNEKLPHVFNWGMHFPSWQYMTTFAEYMLAASIAGFSPLKNEIHGRIHAPEIPSVDLLDDYKFFSVICFQAS